MPAVLLQLIHAILGTRQFVKILSPVLHDEDLSLGCSLIDLGNSLHIFPGFNVLVYK